MGDTTTFLVIGGAAAAVLLVLGVLLVVAFVRLAAARREVQALQARLAVLTARVERIEGAEPAPGTGPGTSAGPDHAAETYLVPEALRRWRTQSGHSQRAAAQVLGVTPGLVARAESRPWVLKMESVLSVLRPAGYDLVVVDQDGVPLAEDLRSEEVLARTASGRRFPATSEVVRLTNEPRWMAKRGQSFQSHGPQWTGERRPGQYP